MGTKRHEVLFPPPAMTEIGRRVSNGVDQANRKVALMIQADQER